MVHNKVKRNPVRSFFFWTLMFLAVASLIYTAITLRGDSGACLANPINFGLKQYDEAYNTHSQAVVSINKEGYLAWIATADKNTPIGNDGYLGSSGIPGNITIRLAP